MAKNAKFRRQYKITIEGITTNGFSEKVFDNILRYTVAAMNEQRKQVEVTLEEL